MLAYAEVGLLLPPFFLLLSGDYGFWWISRNEVLFLIAVLVVKVMVVLTFATDPLFPHLFKGKLIGRVLRLSLSKHTKPLYLLIREHLDTYD